MRKGKHGMSPFVFDPATQGPPEMAETWVFGKADAESIMKLRSQYPELLHWSDAHLIAAWGNYSQDILAVGFADIQERDSGLLAYLYVQQEAPNFDFLGTGLFNMAVWNLADAAPWLTHAPLSSPFNKEQK
jgi:hypothetical protein